MTMTQLLDQNATTQHLRDLVSELNEAERALGAAMGRAHDAGYVCDLRGFFAERKMVVVPPVPSASELPKE